MLSYSLIGLLQNLFMIIIVVVDFYLFPISIEFHFIISAHTFMTVFKLAF